MFGELRPGWPVSSGRGGDPDAVDFINGIKTFPVKFFWIDTTFVPETSHAQRRGYRQTILDQAVRLVSMVGPAPDDRHAGHRDRHVQSGLVAHFNSKESLEIQVLEHAGVRFREHVVHPMLAAPRGEPRSARCSTSG